MILFEFEGKQLLAKYGISVPSSQLLTNLSNPINLSLPLVLKAQVLSGKRAEKGGILIVKTEVELKKGLKKILGMELNKETVDKILIEELIEIEKEYYLSLTYNTDKRTVILSVSESGGTGIEERKVNNIDINLLNPIGNITQDKLFGLPQELIIKLIDLFFKEDCLLLEINPLVKVKLAVIPAKVFDPESSDRRAGIHGSPNRSGMTKEDQDDSSLWLALDAKVKLDDDAKFRHDPSTGSGQGWDYPPRSVPGHTPTQNEIEAKKIDQGDYRGTAGSAYFDLDGDIAVLSSGGGVSLTSLDALIKFGGKPGNYTEYSGNPPKEKVVKLTKIVLNKQSLRDESLKPNIHGLWIIGTVAANFTDIYETLSGIIDGLREVEKELNTKFNFPIVIRRGGPREEEAFEMLRGVKDFNLTIQGEETSITKSAEVMYNLAKEYASKSK